MHCTAGFATTFDWFFREVGKSASQTHGYKQGYHRFGLKNKDDQKKTTFIGIFFLFKRQHKCKNHL